MANFMISLWVVLCAPWSWHRAGDKSGWRYWENSVTGERTATRLSRSAPWGPLDVAWLNRRLDRLTQQVSPPLRAIDGGM